VLCGAFLGQVAGYKWRRWQAERLREQTAQI
jgi:hypothetical protein